jgi:hypothetical protein
LQVNCYLALGYDLGITIQILLLHILTVGRF